MESRPKLQDDVRKGDSVRLESKDGTHPSRYEFVVYDRLDDLITDGKVYFNLNDFKAFNLGQADVYSPGTVIDVSRILDGSEVIERYFKTGYYYGPGDHKTRWTSLKGYDVDWYQIVTGRNASTALRREITVILEGVKK